MTTSPSRSHYFIAAFPIVTRVLHCAVDIQKAFADYDRKRPESPINIRVGLNSGESIQDGGDYSGTAVTVAAGIADKARGGQILLSEEDKDHGGMLIEWLKEKLYRSLSSVVGPPG